MSKPRQLEPVRFIAFGTPRLVAQGVDMGFFEREGIALETASTQNSEQQMQQLRDLEWGIAGTNADNVVFWVEDHGADFFIFMVRSGAVNQEFFVRPEIQSFEDVRGKTLAVDSAHSGYATVLRRILLRNGLAIDRDYRFLPVGNTGMRTTAVIDGRAVGAMLGNASDEAVAAGVHSLANGNDYAPEYAGNLFVTTRRWAADNPHLVLAFIRAILNTRTWLADPGKAEEAVASIARTDRVDPNRAQQTYQRALTELGGASVAEQVQLDAMQAVIDLRHEVGLLPSPTPASRYVNSNWYRLALESLAERP